MTDHLDPRVHNFLNKKESSKSLVEFAKKKKKWKKKRKVGVCLSNEIGQTRLIC